MDTHMHTYIDTYEREGLLNPLTVGVTEPRRLSVTSGSNTHSVTVGLKGSHCFLTQVRWGSVGLKETGDHRFLGGLNAWMVELVKKVSLF